MRWSFDDYATDLSDFLNVPKPEAEERLSKGFMWNHAEVAADFVKASPVTDAEILEWYMTTTSYLYAELPAYHLDAGFNYTGMCEGIVNRLLAANARDVLVLGDGIGDLTMALHEAGMNAVYHDLKGSRTAEFALFRQQRAYGVDGPSQLWTDGWESSFGFERWDATLSLDFFEHLPEPEVERWATAVAAGLRPGGQLGAQNAFACGDNENGGSIPMHVSASNHYEHDWVPLMASLGMVQTGDIWWTKL